ncbi:MAG: SRPBCC family protein [Candidatus Sumerlaeaceae bacterium]|jgi:ligand-binding SRPBCC domain-containing protein
MPRLFRFEQQQLIPTSLERAWEFFCNPANLKTITPPDMGFEILTPVPPVAEPGLIIVYKVRPLLGIPVQWITEITHVVPQQSFVDEQRFGPYRFWHHRHIFEPKDRGVLMSDIIHYALPIPVVATLVNNFVVRPRLNEIFSYRRQKIEEIFGRA